MRFPSCWLVLLPLVPLACGGGDVATSSGSQNGGAGATRDAGAGGSASSTGGVSASGGHGSGGTPTNGGGPSGGGASGNDNGGAGNGHTDAGLAGAGGTGAGGTGTGGLDAAIDASSGELDGGDARASIGGAGAGGNDAGGDAGGTPIACPYNGPAIVDPTTFPSCASATCTTAHCVPAGTVTPAEQALFATCNGGRCVPDPIIASANHYVPPTCRSLAGVEGRCLSTCLPEIAAQSSTLPGSGCSAGTLCAPCYDPVSADPTAPTGFCSLGCDAPTEAPVVLSCPWTGPAVINPISLPTCGPAANCRCAPSAVVPPSAQGSLVACSSVPNGFCVPAEVLTTGGNFQLTHCAPFPDVMSDTTQGRCTSLCLKGALGTLTFQSTCDSSHQCTPCFDPRTGASTGACSASLCDSPPATKFTFPKCGGNGGLCVPTALLGGAGVTPTLPQETCPDSDYRCVPLDWLPGGVPKTCTYLSFPGACVPTFVYDGTTIPPFPRGSCPTASICLPCQNAQAGTPGCP